MSPSSSEVLLCVCVSGLLLGQVLGHRVPGGSSLMLISVALLLSTLAIHAGLMQLGVDLTWSVFFLCSVSRDAPTPAPGRGTELLCRWW